MDRLAGSAGGESRSRRQRVLVLRPGAIGDTLLTFPALTALCDRFPELSLHLVGNRAAAPLAVLAGLADGWTDFDAPVVGRLFVPRAGHAAEELGPLGAAVAWGADPVGTLAANLALLGATRVLVAPSRPSPEARIHVADHLVRTLAPLGAKVADAQRLVRFAFPDGLAGAALERLAALGLDRRAFVAVHPGSGSSRKNWPPDSVARLVDQLADATGAVPLLVAGPADDEALDRLLPRLRTRPPLLRDLPFDLLAAILARARAYVGNDSGPTHLAAMLGLPTLALFGPTDPALWAPRGPRVRVVRHEPLGELEPDVVMRALDDLLGPEASRNDLRAR